MKSFYACRRIFEEREMDEITKESYSIPKVIDDVSYKIKKQVFSLYESNIKPLIRFIHETEIKPCGWISVNVSKENKTKNKLLQTYCKQNYTLQQKFVKYVDRNDNAPITNVFYDTECDISWRFSTSNKRL